MHEVSRGAMYALWLDKQDAEAAGDDETARRLQEKAVAVHRVIARRFSATLYKRLWMRGLVMTAVRPRERRDATGRSSARSGDGGADDGPSSSWLRFVRDVLERITEAEVARERDGGWWT